MEYLGSGLWINKPDEPAYGALEYANTIASKRSTTKSTGNGGVSSSVPKRTIKYKDLDNYLIKEGYKKIAEVSELTMDEAVNDFVVPQINQEALDKMVEQFMPKKASTILGWVEVIKQAYKVGNRIDRDRFLWAHGGGTLVDYSQSISPVEMPQEVGFRTDMVTKNARTIYDKDGNVTYLNVTYEIVSQGYYGAKTPNGYSYEHEIIDDTENVMQCLM